MDAAELVLAVLEDPPAIASALIGGLLAGGASWMVLRAEVRSRRDERLMDAAATCRAAALELHALGEGATAESVTAYAAFQDALFTLEGLLWRWRGRGWLPRTRRLWGFSRTVWQLGEAFVAVPREGPEGRERAILLRAISLACLDFEAKPDLYGGRRSRANELRDSIAQTH